MRHPTTKGALDGGQPRPEAGVDIDRLPLSRRELLVGAGGVLLAGGLAACGSSGSSSAAASGGGSTPAGTPKKGGNFRLGVTGGGANDIIDGQSIVTKPDQARLIGSWETLMTYNEDYVLGTDGLAEEVDSRCRARSTCASGRASSSTTARRSPPTTSSTRSSAS